MSATACAMCGHDPSALITATWQFHIPRNIKSGNSRQVNAGASRWAYAKERDAWQADFKTVRIGQRLPMATKKRRVTVTRFYGGRQREFDVDNAHAGVKCCIDALVRSGLLVDDRREYAEIHIVQIKTNAPTQIGTTFTIEELS